jgi:hypothetical protein
MLINVSKKRNMLIKEKEEGEILKGLIHLMWGKG